MIVAEGLIHLPLHFDARSNLHAIHNLLKRFEYFKIRLDTVAISFVINPTMKNRLLILLMLLLATAQGFPAERQASQKGFRILRVSSARAA